jgi:hypothetical protein
MQAANERDAAAFTDIRDHGPRLRHLELPEDRPPGRDADDDERADMGFQSL